MKLVRLVAPALGLVFAGAASASTLVSPAMEPPAGGLITCFVVNAGATPRSVHIDILGIQGADSPLQSFDHMLAPGDAKGLAVFNDFARYCRFSFKGSKKTLRASIVVRDSTGTPLAALDAR